MPKLTVSNYPEMLRKLSTSVFLVSCACIYIIRSNVVYLDSAIGILDVTPPVTLFGLDSITVPFGTLLISFALALISESVKLHDRISDLLNIRRDFDLRWILTPMALLSGASIDPTQFDKMQFERQRMMSKVFYAFASSTPGRQVIDPHLITQALTSWSWYWLFVEATVVLIGTSAVMAAAQEFTWVVGLLTLVLLLIALMRLYKAECSRYADRQVHEILSDHNRRAAIAAAFNAL